MLRLEYGSELAAALKSYDLPISESQARLSRKFAVAKSASGRTSDIEVISIGAGYLANWYFHLESKPLKNKKEIKGWLEVRLPQLKRSAELATLTALIFNSDPPRPNEFDLKNVNSDPLISKCILVSFSNYRIKSADEVRIADTCLGVVRQSHAHPGLILYTESGALMEKYFFTKKLAYLEQAVVKREAAMKIDTRVAEIEFSKPFLKYWKAKIAKKKADGGG